MTAGLIRKLRLRGEPIPPDLLRWERSRLAEEPENYDPFDGNPAGVREQWAQSPADVEGHLASTCSQYSRSFSRSWTTSWPRLVLIRPIWMKS